MKTFSLVSAVLLIISNGIYAQDVLFAKSGAVITVQNGANLYVGAGINLDNGSTVNNEGTITIARTGAATANFTDNTVTPYTYGTGKFICTGTGIQTVSSLNQFERIEVDNGGLNLSTTVKANTWYLKAGKVNTGAFFAIASNANVNAVQADATNTNFANSWINGNLRRFITPATVNNYRFPVGNANRVNIAELDNLTASPLTGVTYVTASFGPKLGNDVGLSVIELGMPYLSVNSRGVWYLVPDANPTGGIYDLKLFFNGFLGLIDNNFGILRRPDASSNAAEWMVPAGSALPAAGSLGRTVAGGYARRNNMSTFSQLGIGTSFVEGPPLPLQLLSFYAVKKDKHVLLQWTTANEINTSHFEIYKAGQPVSLQYLDKVAAAGFSTANRSYNYIDLKPFKGLNFYHLKMVDKDNSYKLSQVVKVNFDDIPSLNIYPNPVTNNILFVDYNGAKVKDIKLITSDGKQVACSFTTQSNNQLKVTIPFVVAKGTYVLQLNTDEGLRNTKVVIE